MYSYTQREAALPLYLCLLLHNKTKKRELIDNMFDKGHMIESSSYLQLKLIEP